ncbi:MAG: glycosyltransferase family 2 protein [Candidatus Eisenbacteria bacterium]|nr:glycosyltransferase family 2 protein [Candidatus Eisenbacteria bacterium]
MSVEKTDTNPGNKISATVICYNEEEKIEACLGSLRWADEIIVIDSGSTDKTLEIAGRFTDKLFSGPWPGYGEQKNKAIQKASYDWILSIDADERVTDELAREVRKALDENAACDGFFIPRKTFYCGKWIRHCGWYPDRKLRLFKKTKGRWSPGLHERVILNGKAGDLSANILHESFTSIGEHIRTIENFTSIAARELRDSGKKARLFDLLVRPGAAFFKMYFVKRGFLDGFEGFLVSILSSFHVFLKYSKLGLIEREERRRGWARSA